jgi:hypothetical protein
MRILDQEPHHFSTLCTLAQCLSKVIARIHSQLWISLILAMKLRRPEEALNRASQAVKVCVVCL